MNDNTMTAQEVFDTVVSGLRAQGKRSVVVGEDPNNLAANCAYRGQDGTKCAAGILIHDDEYSPNMEGFGILALLYEGRYPSLEKRLYSHASFICCLQQAPDDRDPSGWETAFIEIAESFHLTLIPPNNP